MSLRFLRLCLLASLPATLSTQAQTPPSPATPGTTVPAPAPAAPGAVAATVGDDLVGPLKMPAADLETVLGALREYTGRDILRPAQLPTVAEYNIWIPRLIPRSEAVLAIETVLELNGIGVIPRGDRFLVVVPLPQAKSEAPQMITGSTLDLPPSGRVATKIFLFDFLRVNEFMPQLSQMLTPGIAGGVVQLEKTNAALVTDTVSNLQRIELLLKEADRPITAGIKPKFYPLQSAKASDVVNKLNGILGTVRPQLGTATSYNADDRTNQIVLIADPRQHTFFDELIAKLDVKADPNTRNEVIYLKYAEAPAVASLLTNIVQGQSTAAQRSGSQQNQRGQNRQPGMNQPGVQPNVPQPALPQPTPPPTIDLGGPNDLGGSEFSSLITINPDERSNAVIVSGTVDDIRLIQELISKIDIVLAQVRIEVVIAEVTLGDNFETGIQQLGLVVQGDKLVGFALDTPGFDITGGGTEPNAAITRPGSTGFVSGAFDLAGTIRIGTSPRKDNATILSVPSITTSHAKEATVFVGESRPLITGSVNSGVNGGTTSTVTQTDIGINLVVTPLIGVDGSVQLDIKQDVNEVGPTVTIDENEQPVILKRNTDSFVSVKSGEIVVLGGLQRQKSIKKTNRLGPIPFIGDLFGYRQRGNFRTELIFFLRPVVLTNTPADNQPALNAVDKMPHKDDIRRELDPSYVPEKKTLIDRIKP